MSLRPAKRRKLARAWPTRCARPSIRVLKPGEKLSEVKIAQELEVSRAPVRDALAELERDG